MNLLTERTGMKLGLGNEGIASGRGDYADEKGLTAQTAVE